MVHSSSETPLMSKLDCRSYVESVAGIERLRLQQMQQIRDQFATVGRFDINCKVCFGCSCKAIVYNKAPINLAVLSSWSALSSLWCTLHVAPIVSPSAFVGHELVSCVIGMWRLLSECLAKLLAPASSSEAVR